MALLSNDFSSKPILQNQNLTNVSVTRAYIAGESEMRWRKTAAILETNYKWLLFRLFLEYCDRDLIVQGSAQPVFVWVNQHLVWPCR